MKIKRFTKEGFAWKYHGDTLRVRWFWVNKPLYYSYERNEEFETLLLYWKSLGELHNRNTSKIINKVDSFALEDVFETFTRTMYPDRSVVVLHDIDVSKKSDAFWATLGKDTSVKFCDDFAVLLCKDKDQAIQVAESISGSDASFAKALVYVAGVYEPIFTYPELFDGYNQ